MMKLGKCTLAFALAGLLTSAASAAVDFEKQILPFFKDRCFDCHGPDKDKGDLRLDTKEFILKGGETGDTLVAGDPAASELLFRVELSADDDDIMPPKGDPLTKEQIQLLTDWIKEGGEFGEWVGDANASHGAITKTMLPEVAEAPAKAIDKLRSAGALAMPLARDTNLINVDFRAVADQIGDSHLVDLKSVRDQLCWLNLGRSKITNNGLAVLKGMPHLMRLHLENTQVSDAGLAHLKGLEQLEYLNLYGSKVTNAGLNHLRGLKNLKKLYLWQTEVNDTGVRRLKRALPNLVVDTGWKAPVVAAKPAEPKPAAKPAAKPVAAKPAPKPALAKLTGVLKAGSCCDKAFKADKACAHSCCKEAAEAGKLCTKCNPQPKAITAKLVAAKAPPKPKGPSIGKIMTEAHKGANSLFKKVTEKSPTKADTAKLVGYYTQLAQSTPTKGAKASWVNKTGALLAAAIRVDGGDKGAIALLKRAGSCKACHDVHKED
ncbi:MAG: c-type cytochrome domain-containing protein [Planctomycetota bacterium]|jgi:mono/diheme cytochrome c family protein